MAGVVVSCLCLRCLAVQAVYIELLDMLEDNHHRLLLALFLHLFRSTLPLVFINWNVVVFPQNATCFRKIHLFMFHDKSDGITTFATDETMADVLRRTDVERWVAVLMKRTFTFPVDTTFFQGNVFPHNLKYREVVELFNRLIFNHSYSYLVLQKYLPTVNYQKTSAGYFIHLPPPTQLLSIPSF